MSPVVAVEENVIFSYRQHIFHLYRIPVSIAPVGKISVGSNKCPRQTELEIALARTEFTTRIKTAEW